MVYGGPLSAFGVAASWCVSSMVNSKRYSCSILKGKVNDNDVDWVREEINEVCVCVCVLQVHLCPVSLFTWTNDRPIPNNVILLSDRFRASLRGPKIQTFTERRGHDPRPPGGILLSNTPSPQTLLPRENCDQHP